MFDAGLDNFIEIASENRIDKPPSMLPFTQLQSQKTAEDGACGQVDEYQECEDWIDFLIAADNESEAFAKGVEIRQLMPRIGAAA